LIGAEQGSGSIWQAERRQGPGGFPGPAAASTISLVRIRTDIGVWQCVQVTVSWVRSDGRGGGASAGGTGTGKVKIVWQ
jgi:hypothetical protein